MDRIYRLCGDASQIVIYGAGTLSNILYLYLKCCNIEKKVKCFVVSDLQGNPTRKYGLEVRQAVPVDCLENGTLILVATQPVTHPAIRRTLEENGYVNFEFVDGEKLLDDFYGLLYKRPIQNNKVFFMHMKGMGYGGNPKYIAEKLRNKAGEKLDLVWAVSEKNLIFPEGIRTVQMGTFEYYSELATAHIWIDNTRKTADIRKREGQYYIQTWHGAAPIKKVEKDAVDSLTDTYIENAKRDSGMADLFLSGSRFYTDLYRKSFWYSGEIMQVGLPRQDVFWSGRNVKNKVYRHYGIDEKYGFVLYAPTFRRDFSSGCYDLDIFNVTEALKARFHKMFVCGVSKHPDIRNMQYQFGREQEYIAVDGYDDFEELLMAADVLITDYSGCMYDFSFTKRPVFLYQKDIEDYKLDRDFYIPMEKLPYIQASTNRKLIDSILDFDAERYQKKLQEFMDKMENFDNGTASDQVAERVFGMIQKPA